MAGLPVFLIGLVPVLFAGIPLLTGMASELTITRPLPSALPLLAGIVLVALSGLRRWWWLRKSPA
jgi:hypothetical protein